MKKIFVSILMVLVMVVVCEATPFLVSDPPVEGTIPTSYKLTGPAWIPSSVPAQSDGTIKLDVTNALVGSNAITVTSCVVDLIWGEICAVPFPYTFIRPAPPVTIRAIKLIQ